MTWSERQPEQRISKYRDALALVKAEQHEHPDKWKEIMRYERTTTAYETATKMRAKYPDFEFRSTVDQSTRDGVLYARHTGGTHG